MNEIKYRDQIYKVLKDDNEYIVLKSEKTKKEFTIKKEQYERLSTSIDIKNGEHKNKKRLLVSFYNDLIDFNAFQYKPYLKLTHKNNIKKCIYIGDEVGVGKTFSSGIIISELLFSQKISINRPIVIICPNMLCQKWQKVLDDFFGLSSKIIKDTEQISNISIISFDTISRSKKEDFNVPQLELLIIDEAHNVSNTRLNKIMKFRAQSQYTVLLSATPLSGKKENSSVQKQLLFNNDIERDFSFEEEGIYFNRTLKEEMRKKSVNWNIQNISITNKTLEKYISICEDIFSGKNTLLRFVGLDMIRSSPAAARAYIDYLTQLDDEQIKKLSVSSSIDLEEVQEYGYGSISEIIDDWDLDEIVEEKDIDIEGIKEKIVQLKQCIEDNTGVDEKLEALKDILSKNKHEYKRLTQEESVDEQRKSVFYKKCVVFVNYNETAHYLNQNIEESILINGEISSQTKLERFNKFKESDDYNVLIITNVACEGQDMDFCNTLINYDLTYNPVQLAQRKGRIDRFEVKKTDLFIYNFITENIDPTHEEIEKFVENGVDISKYRNSIYSVLLRKLKAINEETGIYYNVIDTKGKSKKAANKVDSEKKLLEMFDDFLKDNSNMTSRVQSMKDLEVIYNQMDYTFINEILKGKGIKIEEAENQSYLIEVKKKNKDILRYILDGATINSHLIYNA